MYIIDIIFKVDYNVNYIVLYVISIPVCVILISDLHGLKACHSLFFEFTQIIVIFYCCNFQFPECSIVVVLF